MKAYVTLHFSYCPLKWLFHSRNMEHHINKIRKRTLNLVFNDTLNLSFDSLLVKNK